MKKEGKEESTHRLCQGAGDNSHSSACCSFFLPTVCTLLPPSYPAISFRHYKALQRSKSSLTMSLHNVSASMLAESQLACVKNHHQNLFNYCSQCSILTKHWNGHSSSKLMPSDGTLQQCSHDFDVGCFNYFLFRTINSLFGLLWKVVFANTAKADLSDFPQFSMNLLLKEVLCRFGFKIYHSQKKMLFLLGLPPPMTCCWIRTLSWLALELRVGTMIGCSSQCLQLIQLLMI